MAQVIYGTGEHPVEACVGGVSEDRGGGSIDCPLLHGPAGPQHQKIQAFELQLQFKQEVKPEPVRHLMFGPIIVERKGRT